MKDRPTGPERLDSVLGSLFVSRGWARLSERAKLESAWLTAAGEAIAADARVTSLRRGVLEVEVRSSVLQQELAQFYKRKLLKTLRETMPHLTVTDLKFRAAKW